MNVNDALCWISGATPSAEWLGPCHGRDASDARTLLSAIFHVVALAFGSKAQQPRGCGSAASRDPTRLGWGVLASESSLPARSGACTGARRMAGTSDIALHHCVASTCRVGAFCFADSLGRDATVFLQRLWALECLNCLTADGRLPKTLFPPDARDLRFVLQAPNGSLAGASHRESLKR